MPYREVLQYVLETVLTQCGTHAKAADRLRIDQSTFTRLLNGQEVLAFDTYARMHEALVQGPALGMEDLLLGELLEIPRYKNKILEFVERHTGRRELPRIAGDMRSDRRSWFDEQVDRRVLLAVHEPSNR